MVYNISNKRGGSCPVVTYLYKGDIKMKYVFVLDIAKGFKRITSKDLQELMIKGFWTSMDIDTLPDFRGNVKEANKYIKEVLQEKEMKIYRVDLYECSDGFLREASDVRAWLQDNGIIDYHCNDDLTTTIYLKGKGVQVEVTHMQAQNMKRLQTFTRKYTDFSFK